MSKTPDFSCLESLLRPQAQGVLMKPFVVKFDALSVLFADQSNKDVIVGACRIYDKEDTACKEGVQIPFCCMHPLTQSCYLMFYEICPISHITEGWMEFFKNPSTPLNDLIGKVIFTPGKEKLAEIVMRYIAKPRLLQAKIFSANVNLYKDIQVDTTDISWTFEVLVYNASDLAVITELMSL